MPRSNRSDTFYVPLPSHLATSSIPDLKLAISVTVTHPAGMEKFAQKAIVTVTDEAQDIFKIHAKKAIRKEEK